MAQVEETQVTHWEWWYGDGGVRVRTFWQLVTSLVVLVAAVLVVQARNDVSDLLERQKADEAARTMQRLQGVRARRQQCALTPIFVKALDTSKLTVREERVFSASVQRGLKGCP